MVGPLIGAVSDRYFRMSAIVMCLSGSPSWLFEVVACVRCTSLGIVSAEMGWTSLSFKLTCGGGGCGLSKVVCEVPCSMFEEHWCIDGDTPADVPPSVSKPCPNRGLDRLHRFPLLLHTKAPTPPPSEHTLHISLLINALQKAAVESSMFREQPKLQARTLARKPPQKIKAQVDPSTCDLECQTVWLEAERLTSTEVAVPNKHTCKQSGGHQSRDC
jgi:hypothetical protein